MPDRKLYIAYGSNLNVRQMRRRCPGAEPYGVADLTGWELLFKGSKTGAYLTIERKENGVVPVAVWKVTADDEERLDCYEGYPSFYYKKEIELPVMSLRTGVVKTRKAFVYIMHEDRQIAVPSSAYLQTCVQGYHDFGFKIQTLADAYARSKEEQYG